MIDRFIFSQGLLALVCVLSATAVSAVDQTFDQVLNSAIKSHPLVLSKRAEVDAAQANLEGAEWGRYPTPTFESASGNNAQSVLRIDQPLWTGGRITGLIEASEHRLTAADVAVEETQLDISLRVITAYTEALKQKARLQHARDNFTEHKALMEKIIRRVEQGVSSLSDRKLAQSRLLGAESDVSVAEQAYESALTRLTQLANQEVTDVDQFGLPEQLALGTLRELQDQSTDYAPTVRRLKMEIEAASSDIKVNRSAYMPELKLRYEHTETSDLTDDSVMVVFEAQPGAGLSSVSAVKAAMATRDSLEKAKLSAEREVKETVSTDYLEWRASSLRTDSTAAASVVSREVFESYSRLYVTGHKSWLELLNAIRELAQSRYTYEETKHQAMAARLRLLARSGQLIPKL